MLESLTGRDLSSKSHEAWGAALRHLWLLLTSSHRAQLEQHPCTLGWVFWEQKLLVQGAGQVWLLVPLAQLP